MYFVYLKCQAYSLLKATKFTFTRRKKLQQPKKFRFDYEISLGLPRKFISFDYEISLGLPESLSWTMKLSNENEKQFPNYTDQGIC